MSGETPQNASGSQATENLSIRSTLYSLAQSPAVERTAEIGA